MAKEHRPLVLFSLITFCFWAPSYFYLQVLPDYAKQLGGSLAIIGWIGGAYGLAQLILRFPVGMWSDAMGRRKPFITAGMLAALVSALMFLLARSVSALFWARTMAGVSATIWVILTVYVAGSFPAGEAPRAMGMLNAFSSLGQLVSSAFGYWAMLSFNTLVALDLGLRMGAFGWLSFWNMAPTIAVSLCLGPPWADSREMGATTPPGRHLLPLCPGYGPDAIVQESVPALSDYRSGRPGPRSRAGAKRDGHGILPGRLRARHVRRAGDLRFRG